MSFDRTLPESLAQLNALEFDYDDGDGIDFEPYERFMSAEDNQSWFRAWTGNPELTGEEFRVFGQDGTGGYAALWLVRPQAPLLGQPVVFLGSEGETGVVARDFADFLWLVAGGFGPLEAVEYPPDGEDSRQEQPTITALAESLAGDARRSPAEVVARAQEEFPGFASWIESLVR